MIELAEIFYEVHRRFYQTPLETYCSAMNELGKMAEARGLTMNDLAKLVTCDNDCEMV